MSSVKVAVRVRPFNKHEVALRSKRVISMSGDATTIWKVDGDDSTSRTFQFDHSFWSHTDASDPLFVSQSLIYKEIGVEALDHALKGYNVCVFAYGQTGSGKSYTMMGKPDDPEHMGLSPRICRDLFTRLDEIRMERQQAKFQSIVEVSYMEIYCERVRDLLNPCGKGRLRVREHPTYGPYVEDLSRCAVQSFDEVNQLINAGNMSRTVASTNMNETSSRSHAVLTLLVTQREVDVHTQLIAEKVSKISLVDLAGSERADATGATGMRLKEGANINRSLTTLGKVIACLAELATSKKKRKNDFIPYRDSVLTWLLRENLGGNSRTMMLATISPADVNYEETLSTLRYADRAKQIVCKAVINEDPNTRIIRELKLEVEHLRRLLRLEQGVPTNEAKELPSDLETSFELKQYEARTEELRASEKLLAELNETLETKLKKTEALRIQREQELRAMGIALRADGALTGVFAPKTPNLVNLNEDPTMSECLIYYLKQGRTRLGHLEEGRDLDIGLLGSFIRPQHCNFLLENSLVTIEPIQDAECYINGSLIKNPTELQSGDRVILGKNHVFRFNNPLARRDRKSVGNDEMTMSVGETMDWTYAICELLDKQGVDLREEMAERLLEMEEQYRREREESDRRFDEQRKEYEGQIQVLLEKVEQQSLMSSMVHEDSVSDEEVDSVWSAREHHLARWAFRRWQRCRLTSRRDILWDNAVFLKEANVMSVELGKKMQYQFIMLTNTSYTPVSKDIAKMVGDMRNSSNKLDDETIVAIEAVNTASGISYKWTLETFRERLLEMRHYFRVEGDFSNLAAHPPASAQCSLKRSILPESSESSTSEVAEMDYQTRMESDREIDYREEEEYSDTNDPFCDRLSWFQAIGRCFVYLTNLYFDVAHEQELQLIDRDGDRVGFVRVRVESSGESPSPRSPAPLKCPSPLFGPASQGGQREGHSNLHFADDEYFSSETNDNDFTDNFAFGNVDYAPISDPLATVIPKETCNGKTPKFRDRQFFPADSTTSETDMLTEEHAKLPWLCEEFLPSHLRIGGKFRWTITILEIQDIPPHFSDVFCQFWFPNKPDEIYSTEPMRDVNTTKKLEFCQVQKVFGHARRDLAMQRLRKQAMLSGSRPNYSIRKCLPATLLTSPPVPSRKCDLAKQTQEGNLISQNDLLVWFEIFELNDVGEYIPVPVRQSDVSPGQGVFMLRQGVQRRIAVTIIHEPLKNAFSDVTFIGVQEVVVGRARDTPEFHFSDSQTRILSLSVFPVNFLPPAGDDRIFFRFEAAWDSSLHGCSFLNKVTPKGQMVYITMSCYVELARCLDTVCLTKDLAMAIFPRSSTFTIPRPIRSLIGSLLNQVDLRHVTGMYDLQFWKIPDKPSTQISTRYSTSSTYVRGEENIRGWRPRSDSLILEHHFELERLRKIREVEKTRQFLSLREALKERKQTDSLQQLDEIIKKLQTGYSHRLPLHSRREISPPNDTSCEPNPDTTSQRAIRPPSLRLDQTDLTNSNETCLIMTCLQILGFKQRTSSGDYVSSPVEGHLTGGLDSDSSLTASEEGTADDVFTATLDMPTESAFVQCGEIQHDMICARCDEVRISPVVNRKGALLISDDLHPGWVLRWIVVRRPFLYVYENEKDTLERRIINLTKAQTQYSADEAEIFGGDVVTPSKADTFTGKTNSPSCQSEIFALTTTDRRIFMKVAPGCSRGEIHEWLYAFNPLVAGEIKSRLGRLKN
uniref:Kinesin-like protein n=1 Tax=Mesocestoides corti TaxID=53468 RepID=A0A5K3EWL2_MESCO